MPKDTPSWMGENRGLTKEEIDEFLEKPIIARLATVKPDGSPYITPVFQEWDGEVMWIIPREKSTFVRYMEENPQVAVSCAIDESPYTRVLIEGKAEIVEGPVKLEGQIWEIGKKMSLRYMGERGPEYAERTIDRPRYLVKIMPEKLTSWSGVEWAEKYVEEES